LKQVKLIERGRLRTYATRRSGSVRFVERGNVWEVPCDIAFPAATQNELTGRDAAVLVKNGCSAVIEAANMPTTPDGVRVFAEGGVAFAPGKAANAGGVATSVLEMQQNAARDSWTFEYTETRLAEIMSTIHETVAATAATYAAPGDYVAGANIAAFLRVAQAMVTLGVI
jgi:glutamate dehydrogenase (NADP+)